MKCGPQRPRYLHEARSEVDSHPSREPDRGMTQMTPERRSHPILRGAVIGAVVGEFLAMCVGNVPPWALPDMVVFANNPKNTMAGAAREQLLLHMAGVAVGAVLGAVTQHRRSTRKPDSSSEAAPK